MTQHKDQCDSIFTIGYGMRSVEDFIALLQANKIQYLIDVRSSPYSRFNPDFSQQSIKVWLNKTNIRYLYMGESLGGRPSDKSCYTEDRVDYEKYREKSFYKAGITRLRNAWKQQLCVALMCSESKPEMCHRSKLIGASLSLVYIQVMHIDEKGQLKTQEQVMELLANQQPHLFGALESSNTSVSRKKYYNAQQRDDTKQVRDSDNRSIRIQRK